MCFLLCLVFCVVGRTAIPLCRLTASQCRRAVSLSASSLGGCGGLLASTWTNMYERQHLEVDETGTFQGKLGGFQMRRARKRDRWSFRVLACRWMEWHFSVTECEPYAYGIQKWDHVKLLLTDDGGLSSACIAQASLYSIACSTTVDSRVLASYHFRTMIVLPAHPPTPPPHLRFLVKTVLREEVGASLVWQPSNGPQHPSSCIFTVSPLI